MRRVVAGLAAAHRVARQCGGNGKGLSASSAARCSSSFAPSANDAHLTRHSHYQPSQRTPSSEASAATVAGDGVAEAQPYTAGQRLSSKKQQLAAGPDLGYFIRQSEGEASEADSTLATHSLPSTLQALDYREAAVGMVGEEDEEGKRGLGVERGGGGALSVYLETYGCQMNVSDSQVVLSILRDGGFREATDINDADVILINTCAIRENAESKIWHRLGAFRNMKTKRKRAQRPTVGVLGCMAERLKARLLESDKLVDVVVGPDAYRDLPHLLHSVRDSDDRRATAMNVQLSLEETYADVMPVRQRGTVSAYLSIMRGCNNMCAFCIVPFTRGRERSRDVGSILREVEALSKAGVKEVTLLGQNVNSYADNSESNSSGAVEGGRAGGSHGDGKEVITGVGKGEGDPFGVYATGFTSVYKPQRSAALSFAELLDRVARVDPEMRIRFTSPHPKDFNDEVLHTIARHHNICSHLHMPAQSGSTAVLASMRRGYTREAYDALIRRVRELLPQVALSTDIITGFCGETEDDHRDTVSLMRATGFDQAFMFAYSKRDKTHAARHLEDDVPADVKQRRLAEIIDTFREVVTQRNLAEVGRRHIILVEGPSKRDPNVWTGRTCHFKRVMFPYAPLPTSYDGATDTGELVDVCIGDYVAVQIGSATTGSLHGSALARTSIAEFAQRHRSTTPATYFPPLADDLLSSSGSTLHQKMAEIGAAAN